MTKALKKFTVFMMVVLCSILIITGSFLAVSAERPLIGNSYNYKEDEVTGEFKFINETECMITLINENDTISVNATYKYNSNDTITIFAFGEKMGVFKTQEYDIVELKETTQPESTDDVKTNLQEMVDGFIGYLKDKYGADYEYYYNIIVEEWGSVEEYLLSFGEKIPEEHKNSWDKFIGWLHEYSVVWIPILAIIVVIIAAVFGKKLVKKVGSWFKSLFTGSNQQSKAIIAQSHALKALMGNNEKFAEIVKELEETEKELK